MNGMSNHDNTLRMQTTSQKIKQRLQRYAHQWLWFLDPKKNIRTIFYHLGLFKFSNKKITGVHLGSGNIHIKDFYNLDTDYFINTDIVAGVEKLKFKDNSVDTIYNSHVFEHTDRKKATAILKEWFRILAPGGTLYIALPNLEYLFTTYLENIKNYDNEKNRALADKACRIVYGGQTNRYDFHFNGYSFPTLKFLLEQTGFHNIEKFDTTMLGLVPQSADASFSGVSLNMKATK